MHGNAEEEEDAEDDKEEGHYVKTSLQSSEVAIVG